MCSPDHKCALEYWVRVRTHQLHCAFVLGLEVSSNGSGKISGGMLQQVTLAMRIENHIARFLPVPIPPPTQPWIRLSNPPSFAGE